MRILLVNDDGVYSPGIRAMAVELMNRHELFIAAPDIERSGAGHSFTLMSPLRCRQAEIGYGLDNIPIYAISGTPVDCVKLALGNLGARPDLLISGINIGANRGADVMYSGTVSAAIEGAILGVPSIAASITSFSPKHLDTAAGAIRKISERLYNNGLNCGFVANINVPDVNHDCIKGLKVTRLGRREYERVYIERTDPFGKRYYWVPSTDISKLEDGTKDDDWSWTQRGYITITPLTTDLTMDSCLSELRSSMEGTDV